MTQVFLSHSTGDAATARQVADALRGAGVSVWIAPDSIEPGQAYNEAIVAGLRNSGTLVILVSAASNASKHVAREVALADDLGKRIIPVRIEAVEPSDALVYYLGLPQWVEWHAQGAAALAPMLALLAGAPTPVQPPPPPPPPTPPPKTFVPQTAAPQTEAVIHIQREKMLTGGLRNMAVLLDGQKVGEIGNGGALELRVTPGRHDLTARIDYIKSEPFGVTVSPGETLALHIAVASLSNLGGQLSGLVGGSGYFKWTRVG